ncbi:MAG: Hpt domain-containing protein, partial [SAR324 cluster bacterium]|nr:Hpt domain-containing protein [SAR324 cluster bacterium]
MDEELQEMIAGFVEDCREGFESMEEDLMAMEEDPESKDTMNNLFRVMHTLKGTAGFMGLNEIQSFAHKMESVFDLVRQEKLILSPKLLDFLLPGIDKLKAMVFGQIGECEIPDATDDISTLEKIIETCSDAILTGETASPPAEVTSTPVETEPVEAAPDAIPDDGIDFDAIMAEHGGNVPVPDEVVEPDTSVDSAFQHALEQVDIEIPASPTEFPEGTSSELLQQFVIEAEEHLMTIEESLLVLEGDHADKETINTFFRAIHSIKGTAGYVNLKQLEMLSHRIETIFDLIRKEEMAYSKEIGDVVFKGIDLLRTMIFFIKNEDFSQQVDITSQIRNLVAIASLKRAETFSSDTPSMEAPSEASLVLTVDADQLNTYLTGAQQQLEVLDIYQVELKKGPLDEHDLITLHRSLKTLHAGAKYCNLVALETAINEYEELLLKVLGGEIEQTKSIIEDTLHPSHKKVIDAINQLKSADLSTLPQPTEAPPKKAEVEKPKEAPPKKAEVEKPKEAPPKKAEVEKP